MAQLTLAGAPVVRAALVVPRVGVWSADVVLERADEAPTRATLSATAGASWTGAVVAQGTYDGRRHVRLVGGAGGLASSPPPKTFRQVSLRTLLLDTLGAVGESLSPATDAAALGRSVAAYARVSAPATCVVAYWAAKAGLLWRVRPDGSVWLGSGQDAPAPARDSVVVLSDRPHRRALVATLETFDLLPGHTVDGRTVESLVYHLDEGSVRVEVLYD